MFLIQARTFWWFRLQWMHVGMSKCWDENLIAENAGNASFKIICGFSVGPLSSMVGYKFKSFAILHC